MRNPFKKIGVITRRIARKLDTSYLMHCVWTYMGATMFLMTIDDYSKSPSILNIIATTIACFIFCYGLISIKRDLKRGGWKRIRDVILGK